MDKATKQGKRVVFARGAWSPMLRRVTGDGYTIPALDLEKTERRLFDTILARSRGWSHEVYLSNVDAKRLATLTDKQLRAARRSLCRKGLMQFVRDGDGRMYRYFIQETQPATNNCD
jgi:hypothetical protein